jgi:hypothetical protein
VQKTILLCITLLWVLSLNAQEDYGKRIEGQREENLSKGLLSNEEFFEKAELVVEVDGKSLRTIGAYDAKKEKRNYSYPHDVDSIYTILAINVKCVYKGDSTLANKTILFVRKEGTLWIKAETNNSTELIDIIEFPPENDFLTIEDAPSVLFFISSDYPENPSDLKYKDEKKYKLFSNTKNAALVCWPRRIEGLNNLHFNNRDELYDYMKQFKGYFVPSQSKFLSSKPVKEYNENVIDSAKYELMKVKWDIDKKKALNKSVQTASWNTLTLTLANRQVIYNSSLHKHHLRFDVLASTNNPNNYGLSGPYDLPPSGIQLTFVSLVNLGSNRVSIPVPILSTSNSSVIALNSIIEESLAVNWPVWIQKIKGPIKPEIAIISQEQPVICNGQPLPLSSNYPAGNVWSNGATVPTIQIQTFEHVTDGENLDISGLLQGVCFLKIAEDNTLVNKKLILHHS